jgi:hypothetical protein
MVIGARKVLASVLGVAVIGSLLSIAPAAAGAADEYVNYSIGLAPRAAPAGAPVQLQGYIGNGAWDEPRVGASVAIYFDPSGTAPRERVGTATTNSDGWFAKVFKPDTSGVYQVVASGGGTVLGKTEATFTKRATSQAVRSGVASATKNGRTARVRVIVQDVVTRLDAQTVYLDAGILTPGNSGNIYAGPSMTNRRAEGRYGVGEFSGSQQEVWRTPYSGVHTYRMSALHPAGLYDVYYEGPIYVYTDFWGADTNMVTVPIADQVVTTLRVRRASNTTISASSTSFTGPKTVTLRGAVRKVQLVSNTEAAIRLSPNTPVKLYFDPSGSAGPEYKKTVRTNSKGVYTTTARTSVSGQWIAKYPGTDLQAPSKRAVTITVR